MKTYRRRTRAEQHTGVRFEPDGQSWCSGHQDWHPHSAFAPDRYKDQRYQRYCLAYNAEYQRNWRRKKKAEGAPVR